MKESGRKSSHPHLELADSSTAVRLARLEDGAAAGDWLAGRVASIDSHLVRLTEQHDALRTQVDDMREERADDRRKLDDVAADVRQMLFIIGAQGAAIGTQGAVLARASIADAEEAAPARAAPSTWPSAVTHGVRSKRAIVTLAGVVAGTVLLVLEHLGSLRP